MGICCKYGRGVEQNWEEAVQWYRRAVDAGSAAAMCNLGVCYERGEGVERDAAEAARLYRQAAEREDAAASATWDICMRPERV